MVAVFNLNTGDYVYYSGIKPANAVAAAYAQSKGDWSTWDYLTKYKALLRWGKSSVSCGDFSAIKESKQIEPLR